MRNPLCLIRMIWRSLRCRAWVSGCNYVEQDGTPENVQVLQCETCGQLSVAWSHNAKSRESE